MLPVNVTVTGGGATESVADPLMEFDLARIVVEPGCTETANPPLPIIATAVFVDVQVTDPLRSCVLPSV